MARGLIISILLFACIALTGCGGEDDGAESLTELAKISIEALKTGDFGIVEPYLFTTADIEWLVTTLKDGKTRNAKKVQETYAEKGVQWMLDESHSDVRESFDELRKELVQEGIDPATLEFVAIHKPMQKTVDGVEMGQCYIRLKFDGKPGEIRLMLCFNAPRGWIMAEGWRS
ncbi:MAG: hypothetical protein QNJ98_06695 [Planctomycetota bacterium]|nr:hypothetical protein [Planctomycetota bacterium]